MRKTVEKVIFLFSVILLLISSGCSKSFIVYSESFHSPVGCIFHIFAETINTGITTQFMRNTFLYLDITKVVITI